MARSAVAPRLLLSALVASPRHSSALLRLSTTASTQAALRRGEATSTWTVRRRKYDDERAQVLRASLPHVSESAVILGAKDVGLSPLVIMGSFRHKEDAALIEFFMEDCLERLIGRIDSADELKNLMLTERLSNLFRIRLEMQVPYISKWSQALSIQSQPMNVPTSLKQRAMLVDEILHAAGSQGSDINWYMKRTVLGGIYSASEVYMVTDHSPEFRDTWLFLEHRIKDAFDFQKTIHEVASLAEAIGASTGTAVCRFLRRLF